MKNLWHGNEADIINIEVLIFTKNSINVKFNTEQNLSPTHRQAQDSSNVPLWTVWELHLCVEKGDYVVDQNERDRGVK
jgi:hypothetical protein